MKRAISSVLVLLFIPLAAWGADKSIALPSDNPHAALKPGPGVEVTRYHCVSCHSTDYIVMQPHGDAKQWEGVVKKMINVFGAQISEQEVKAIVEYLASHYGAR